MRSELEVIDHIEEIPMKCMIISVDSSTPHFHSDYEVIFVLKGSIHIKLGSEQHNMKANDIILINTSEIHSISKEKDNLCLVLQFSPEIIANEYRTKNMFYFNFNTTLEDSSTQKHMDEFYRDLASIGLYLNDKPDGYQFFIKSFFYRFVGHLFLYVRYRVLSEKNTSSDIASLENIKRINSYIELHYKDNFTIDEMCKSLGLSTSTLNRILRLNGAFSCKDLIDYYRLEHSKYLLKNTSNPISAIAQFSGYGSITSFYRAFKKNVGINPIEYRVSGVVSQRIIGVQGYRTFDMAEATELLKSYLT